MKQFNRQRPYDLIILEYGLNVATERGRNYDNYQKGLITAIEHLKECFPQAGILLLSVGDRDYKNENGELRTMPGVKNLIRYQQNIAAESGIAFWNMFEAMGGEVVRIAAGSRDHINAMDMVDGYGDGGDPVIEKSQFILSLFEQLDKKGINAKERSIIDRCVGEVYEEYQHGGAVPTLRVLREKFLEQEEPEAQDLALVSELFTNGSLDAFAHESNVDVNNRIMVYDILDLGKQLKTMGLLVITDAMLNRVTENWKQGKRTHIFLDEFHVVFENEYSGAFFNSAWRRFRKRNAFPTAITQNVEYLLDSVLASTMISNSEYIVMLNQAEPDRAKLATLLNISTEQMGYMR